MPKPPAIDAHIGATFGSFRIVRKLGEGGMGVVYEAEHLKIGHRAVVKLLHPRLADDIEYAQRFLNEARAVNLIRHRGLVEIFDFGKLPDGSLFYVMEFLEGGSLYKRICERNAPFKAAEAVGLGAQIARALAAAHKAGVIHRDLKPENIMLEADPVHPGQDFVKILDFGIAKFHGSKAPGTDPDKTDIATRIGSFMGTQLYMPPEQHGQAEAVDGRADVFSLGVVLYELLAGQLPFQGNALSLLARTPPSVHKLNPAVPKRLSALVERMMSVRRDDRPAMDQVARQLEAMQPGARSGKRLAVVAGAAGLLIGALLITLLNVERIPTPAELRNRSREVLAGYLQDKDSKTRLMAVRALGQSRDFDQRSLLEPLAELHGKPAPDSVALIEEAARALGQVGAVDSTGRLLALLSQTEVPGVPLAAAGALAQLQHPRGLETLKQLFAEGDDLTKVQAALLLLDHRDFSGAPLLWASVTRGRLGEERSIEVLGRLARSDDAQARQRLSEDLSRLQSSEGRVQVAYTLAQLGEDSGWDYLKQAATKAGGLNEQLLALRFLAGLGDTDLRAKLVELAKDRKQPDSIRDQSMAGLGDSAQHDSLIPLSTVLAERGASARLRIAAAGAILKITAGERSRLGEQSLSFARAALGSDSAEMRALAVAMLADMNSEQTIQPLGEALRDREREIRRSAARALGTNNTRAAVQALKPALEDVDPEVRNVAMQSIGHILKTLEQRGDRGAANLVLAELRRMTTGENEPDRIAASAVLVQLGAAQAAERNILRSGLSSKDAQARRLAVELGETDRATLAKALTDPDPAVRLAAARKLASQGFHDGAAVLRAAAAGGDSEGLLAYVALRKLGELVPPPPGLGSLLTSGDLLARLQVLDLLRELPTGDAQRLVRIALLDPVGVVRRRAAEAAADLYRRTKQVSFLRMVRSLRNDPDVIVRAQAAILAEELDKLPKTVPAVDLGQATAPARPAEHVRPASREGSPTQPGMGELVADGDEMVRFQIDKSPPQPITGQPLSVPSGKHRISYLGGAQDVQILPGQTVRVRIPVSLADQLLQDGKEALGRKDFQRAQQSLDRLRRLVQRGKASSSLQADLSYQQARLHEARQQLDAALVEYNRALNVPEGQRRPELNAGLQNTLTRLSSKIGRIQIFTPVDGKCQMTRELLSPPGQQVISVGKGQTRTVYAQVGSITKVTACP
jgi:HEAT repeat protein/tRNA A-37 threonylcarbamoyl transferase component Bud32